jgi:hypothetical protein
MDPINQCCGGSTSFCTVHSATFWPANLPVRPVRKSRVQTIGKSVQLIFGPVQPDLETVHSPAESASEPRTTLVETGSTDFRTNCHEQIAMKNKMIKEFGLNGYNVITKLMEKLDKRKATLDAQEDLLILEKERNLELQELLFNKDEMLEALTKEVSLVKISIEDKEKEMTYMKTSIVNLANQKDALESSMLSLTVQNQELQVQLESCKNFNASSLLVESKASSSNNNI